MGIEIPPNSHFEVNGFPVPLDCERPFQTRAGAGAGVSLDLSATCRALADYPRRGQKKWQGQK